MKIYSTVKIRNKIYVVCNAGERQSHPMPDFMGTGKALCGVLKKNQTLEEFIEIRKKGVNG